MRVGVTRLGLMRVGWWLQGMGWGGEGGEGVVVRVAVDEGGVGGVVRVWL